MIAWCVTAILGAPGLAPERPAPAIVFREGERLIAVTRTAEGAVLEYEDGRLVRAGIGREAILARAEGQGMPDGVEAVRVLSRHLGLYLVRSTRPFEDGLDLTLRLQRELGIMAVMPDLRLMRRASTFEPPADDPRRGGQWFLDVIDIDAAWAHAVGDPSTVIGVVDNGCDLDHPDLAAKMLEGRDVVDGDDDPSYAPDDMGNEHGTACAGLIAAVSDNGEGIAGVCPECRLRCVRLLGAGGGPGGVEVPISADVEAFDRQREWGVAVSSNSWGFTERVPVPWALRNAIIALIEEGRNGLGAVVVFAAGNEAREIFPDELYGIENLVTVGAINAFDEAAQFSNLGSVVDLVAPAGSLTTDIAGRDGADPGDYMSLFGGTSSACPIVAGVAGLLVSAAPDKTGAEIVEAIVETARAAPFAEPDANGHDPLYGYGIVDPLAALERLGVIKGPEVPEGVEVAEPSPEVVEPEADATETAEGDEATPQAPRSGDSSGCHGGASGFSLGFLLVFALRRSRLKIE
jgi:serine protease